MADEPKEDRSVASAIKNTATLVKELTQAPFGLNFNQAWTLVKDGMDRQQHFQDNQVALLVNGYKDVKDDDDDLDKLTQDLIDDEENPVQLLTVVDGDGEVVN